MRVPHQLLVLCVIGLAAATVAWNLPESPDQLNRSADLELVLDDATPISDSATSHDWLVQEPSRRTARRPNFENPSKYNQRTSYGMLKTFGEAIGASWKSTVELTADDERMAYGAIVSADGFIITKDSQLPRKGKIVCRFADGNESEAQVVERSSPLDLVLLRVADRNLTAIQWSDNTVPSRGNWVATTNTQSIPIAVGVVSAGLMSVGPKKAVLGVVLREDNGAVIQKVYSGTGADVAGLQIGDRIRAIDGKKLANQDSAMDVLRTCQPGQSVQLTIQRGESELETHVQMMDLSDDLRDETEMEVNGSISARSSGFSTIFLHDTVLLPNQCGGPLVDLNGRVVGINIARAGRVSSYALPTSVVRPEVERMIAKANGSSISPASPIGPVIPAGAIITSGR